MSKRSRAVGPSDPQYVARQICDPHVLRLIKLWLSCPVEERDGKGRRRMSGNPIVHSLQFHPRPQSSVLLATRWIGEERKPVQPQTARYSPEELPPRSET